MDIEFYKHNISFKDIKNCNRVLRSLFITTGSVNTIIEKKISKYFSNSFVSTVSSWTAGGHLTLYALGIKENDEIITSPLSFVATANVIEYNKAIPIFIDVDQNTANISIKKINKKITSKTKAILPVHLYGQMVDIKQIKKIIPSKILIIEDAAHAFESKIEGIQPGDISDAAIFSFYATKTLTSGEGGAVISKNKSLIYKIKKLRNHGLSLSAYERQKDSYKHYDMDTLGYKYNLTDIQASLLLNQLDFIYERWKKRRQLWNYYDYKISKIRNVDKPSPIPNSTHSYYLYTVWVPPEKRDYILQSLQNKGIGIAVNFRPIHLMSYYRKKYGYRKGSYPNAELIGARTITLPLYPKLKKREIDFICSVLNRLING